MLLTLEWQILIGLFFGLLVTGPGLVSISFDNNITLLDMYMDVKTAKFMMDPK